MNTWKDIFDVPGEHPVKSSIKEHNDDGHDEAVAFSIFWTLFDVVPLNTDALLLILGKVVTAIAKGHT